MEAIELALEERQEKGTAAGARLRRAGKVPAVVYEGGSSNFPVVLAEIDYRRFVSGKSAGQLYKFVSSSKALSGRLALVKDLQIEPIKGQIQHLDFLAVDEKKPIKVFVALEIRGECPSVKLGEGILNVSVHELEVECLPTQIPSVLYADVSSVTLGHSLHARDIVLPEGTKLVSDPDISVVGVALKKAEEIVEAAPVAAAATPAAGAAPAAGKGGAAAPAAAKAPEKKK
jgi:large subunit ribosomal protein L25